MLIKNARVFTEDGSFMQGDVVVKDGRFDSVLERTADTDAAADSTQQEIIDASGLIMIPGLVDIHFHGCKGADMCDGTKEALDVITAYEASIGVTSVCPATMTIQRDELLSVMKNAMVIIIIMVVAHLVGTIWRDLLSVLLKRAHRRQRISC